MLAAIAMAGLFIGTLWAISQGAALIDRSKGELTGLQFASLLRVLAFDSLWAPLWLVSGMGYGWLVRRLLLGRRFTSILTQVNLGVATLLMLDWLAAWNGLLSPAIIWTLSVFGWFLLILQAREHWNDVSRPEGWPGLPWTAVLAIPAVAMIAAACTHAPGGLWPSEFGGYDALSYHLQLPKEWIAQGRMVGLEHNVYSYLPSFLEAGYMHLALWYPGGMTDAAYAAQMLHALLALVAALTLGRILTLLIREQNPASRPGVRGTLVAGIYLAIPWTLVTASLAYNDQAVVALGAGAVLLLIRSASLDWLAPWRPAMAAGLLCGAACLAKLTAIGFIAAPVFLFMMIRGDDPPARRIRLGLIFLTTCALMGGLWMFRNWLWTGQPAFPLLTNLLGAAHWSSDQAARFNAAHGPSAPIAERFGLLWACLFGGPARVGGEQFGFVIWPALLGAIGVLLKFAQPPARKLLWGLLAMLGAQILFWFFFTHHQSRFLIPLLLPAGILVGMALGHLRGRWVELVTGVVILWLTAQGYRQYLSVPNIQLFIDAAFIFREPADHNSALRMESFINGLPLDTRIYAEGFATPLYLDKPIHYHTVWDASPLGRALRQAAADSSEKEARAAIAWLKEQGYTHFLVDYEMLDLWLKPGNYGYDPSISPNKLQDWTKYGLQLVHIRGPMHLYRVK